jgi:hypothetical protein
MSITANWSYTVTCTVWAAGVRDKFGKPSFGVPFTILAAFASGGDTKRDDSGVEFVPVGTFWTESAVPLRDDYIIIGDLTANPDPVDAGAKPIRKRERHDMSTFNESDDYGLFT